ncbi:MAG: TlpA family protein disulfide reductase [Mogibacterium sp.]|nr:TlpA family protein disulfide reductase [Mogibacterium sp.]
MEQGKKKKKGGCLKTALIILLVLIIGIVLAGFIWYKTHEEDIKKLNDAAHHDTLTGQKSPDFEVTTTDGETVSMSSLLEGKEALVVVLFATWCKPCEKEFPEMDSVYQKYQDKMGMIALDIDKLDTEDDAKKYAESHGFAFPIAKGNDSLGIITTTAYPTTLVIDRNGKIGMCRIGSIPDAETFERIVTTFIGDDYQERQLAYYTFYAASSKELIPGVEFTVTSESGTQTYTTGEGGRYDLFMDKPEDMKVKVTSVPDGHSIDGTGEIQSGTGSTVIMLPVK